MLFDELEEGTDESSNDYYSAEDVGDVTYSIDDRRGRKRKKKRVKKKTKSLQGFKLAFKKGIDIKLCIICQASKKVAPIGTASGRKTLLKCAEEKNDVVLERIRSTAPLQR